MVRILISAPRESATLAEIQTSPERRTTIKRKRAGAAEQQHHLDIRGKGFTIELKDDDHMGHHQRPTNNNEKNQ